MGCVDSTANSWASIGTLKSLVIKIKYSCEV